MKKKLMTSIVLVMCAVALVVGSVLTTMAFLTSSSSVSNVFTVGNVKINMFEYKVNSNGQLIDAKGNVIEYKENSEGNGGWYVLNDGRLTTELSSPVKVDTNSYHLIPGNTYIKNPTIEILSGESDYMYLFVKSINYIRRAEEGNYEDGDIENHPSMRAQMEQYGWVEYVRSGDGTEIVWVYGKRNANGEITPAPVNCDSTQERPNGSTGPAGEFRLCDQFTIYQHVDVTGFGAASVTFTGFAIQATGFTGENVKDHALTQAAWNAIKESIPFNTGIVNPVNPYDLDKTGDKAYEVVPGASEPEFDPYESLAPNVTEATDPTETT